MNDAELEQDRWLAGKRTELSWSRSGLAALACVLILVRRLSSLVTTGRAQVLALALLVVVATAGGMFALTWHARTRRHRPPQLLAITVGTAVLAGVGLVLAIFPPR